MFELLGIILGTCIIVGSLFLIRKEKLQLGRKNNYKLLTVLIIVGILILAISIKFYLERIGYSIPLTPIQ